MLEQLAGTHIITQKMVSLLVDVKEFHEHNFKTTTNTIIKRFFSFRQLVNS